MSNIDVLPTDVLGSDATGTGLPTDVPGSDVSAVNTYDQDPNAAPTTLDLRIAQQQADNQVQYNPTISGGITTTLAPGSIGAKIVQSAEHYLGTPYQWGGTGPGGVDCSGLVQLAYKAAGINLPRVSFEQAGAGRRTTLKGLRPGDLVAWDNSPRNPGADHIAIYLGNGWIIEAAHPGSTVRTRRLGSNEGAWGVRMDW